MGAPRAFDAVTWPWGSLSRDQAPSPRARRPTCKGSRAVLSESQATLGNLPRSHPPRFWETNGGGGFGMFASVVLVAAVSPARSSVGPAQGPEVATVTNS